MRGSKIIFTSLVLGMGLWGAGMGAPAMAADASCQKMSGEVSVLIDKSGTSKNLPAARAQFQAGIMDCMEGDDASASKHYQQAKTLLTGEAPAPVPVAVKTEAPAEADCQKLGGEVSALIDKAGPSKNLPTARAKFQAGIMQCMEGDDTSANKFYQDAKSLLNE